MTRLISRFLMGCTAVLGMQYVANADLVSNGSFEQVGTQSSTITNGIGPGDAAASGWSTFNNVDGSTETQHMTYGDALLPPIFLNDPGAGGEHVIRVEASHGNNGLVQVFGALNTGPLDAEAQVWVYVNSGMVGLGLGNGGGSGLTSFSQTTGQWELLTTTANTSPVNEIIIYAAGGSAEFYVDLASANAIPEPATAGMLGTIGVAGLAFVRRRRNGKATS